MRPVEQTWTHVARNAEQIGDDRDGNGRREVGQKIGLAPFDKSVDPLMRKARYVWREFLNLTRHERAIDERPEPCVLGRLEFQKRIALQRVEGLKMAFRRRPA